MTESKLPAKTWRLDFFPPALRRHLVLHGLPAAFHVAVGQDDALLVHPRLLLHVGLQHSHFQAAAQHDGGVACVQQTRTRLS